MPRSRHETSSDSLYALIWRTGRRTLRTLPVETQCSSQVPQFPFSATPQVDQIDERTEQIHRAPLSIAELHKLMPATQKLQHRTDRNTSPYWRQVKITGELKTDQAQYVRADVVTPQALRARD